MNCLLSTTSTFYLIFYTIYRLLYFFYCLMYYLIMPSVYLFRFTVYFLLLTVTYLLCSCVLVHVYFLQVNINCSFAYSLLYSVYCSLLTVTFKIPAWFFHCSMWVFFRCLTGSPDWPARASSVTGQTHWKKPTLDCGAKGERQTKISKTVDWFLVRINYTILHGWKTKAKRKTNQIVYVNQNIKV